MKSLRQEFEEFHSRHPGVYEAFERFTFNVIHAGRRTFGAKAIMERVRWYAQIEKAGGSFKCNNNYTAFYARLFVEHHPEHEFFFQKRRSLADKTPVGI